jgi:hypothetical protein
LPAPNGNFVETCKSKSAACNGGKYDPTPSPRRSELPPRYNTGRMNRQDGPEEVSLGERCLTGGSRGHWEDSTLVIDVTNFSPKTDCQGSRENLHLGERWTRTGPKTLEYVVRIEDPEVWTRPWTVKQEFTKQSDAENRIYTEPRCIEGNYGLPGLLHGRRTEERAFAEGRGPDPATKDNMTAGSALDGDPFLR